jgi:hypothetical protein
MMTQRRLRDVQRLSRVGKRAGISDRQEVPELSQIEAHPNVPLASPEKANSF